MKIFLAAPEAVEKENQKLLDGKYILSSYYGMDNKTLGIAEKSKMFLLDSGAFSFMTGKGGDVNFYEYAEKYAYFIKENNIKYFFELDVDSVLGYKNVIAIRKKIESITNKRSIPVWHISRGIDEFKKMCDEYDYAAIGGIVTKEIKQKQYPYFEYLLREAHKRKCKIHGLGFTSIKQLPKYHFDSVDSTNWLYGRFGHLWYFTGHGIYMAKRPDGKRMISRAGVQAHNLKEWIKFMKYAETHL